MQKNILYIVGLSYIVLGSCKKLVEADPPVDSVTTGAVYSSNNTATSVLNGIYMEMGGIHNSFSGLRSMSLFTGLSGDELISVSPTTDLLSKLFTNTLTNEDIPLWSDLYSYVFRVNDAMEGLTASKTLNPVLKQQLLGEAHFLRGFYYFYLVNLFGAVPLVTSTDYHVNSMLPRADTSKVYDQIVADLLRAKELLSDKYKGADALAASGDRVRPTKAAATAMLARVYLYRKQWASAEAAAGELIGQTGVYSLEDLDDAFLIGSKESILQLQPVIDGILRNTLDGRLFVLSTVGGVTGGPDARADRPVFLSSGLYQSFETGDLRKRRWADTVIVNGVIYPYAFKYKAFQPVTDQTEYLMVLRLGEQFLIRAEARIMQGNIGGAQEDLNAIRHRAGLPDTDATSPETLLEVLQQERRSELFTEWGHRWFDMRRWGIIDAVMDAAAAAKGASWQKYKALYPIPVKDIQAAPALRGHQNPGYPEQ